MMTLGPAPVEPDRELGEVAEEHLRSVPQLNRIRVTGQDQRVQGAAVVHRIEAEARLSDGAVVAVVQWVVAGADDQVFALAVWPAGTDEAVRAAGAAVAASDAVDDGDVQRHLVVDRLLAGPVGRVGVLAQPEI
jgi:hypothetical protein